MLPLLINLNDDISLYGVCRVVETIGEDFFSLERIPPEEFLFNRLEID